MPFFIEGFFIVKLTNGDRMIRFLFVPRNECPAGMMPPSGMISRKNAGMRYPAGMISRKDTGTVCGEERREPPRPGLGIRLFSGKKRNKRIPPSSRVLFESFFIVNFISGIRVLATIDFMQNKRIPSGKTPGCERSSSPLRSAQIATIGPSLANWCVSFANFEERIPGRNESRELRVESRRAPLGDDITWRIFNCKSTKE
jgi:hypothetical protein